MPPLATAMQANAGTPDDSARDAGLDILESSKYRWLKVEEIISLLSPGKVEASSTPKLQPSTSPPLAPPPSGTLLLYDRLAVRNYKFDGHAWVKKRNIPNKVREDHVKLRFQGQYRVSGTYVHSAMVSTMHRRAYRLIGNPNDEAASAGQEGESRKVDLVLVHYLDTNEVVRQKSSLNAGNSSALDSNKSRKKRKIGKSGGSSPRELQSRALVSDRAGASEEKGGNHHVHEAPLDEGTLDILWDTICDDDIEFLDVFQAGTFAADEQTVNPINYYAAI